MSKQGRWLARATMRTTGAASRIRARAPRERAGPGRGEPAIYRSASGTSLSARRVCAQCNNETSIKTIRLVATTNTACLASSGIQAPIAALARSPLDRLAISDPLSREAVRPRRFGRRADATPAAAPDRDWRQDIGKTRPARRRSGHARTPSRSCMRGHRRGAPRYRPLEIFDSTRRPRGSCQPRGRSPLDQARSWLSSHRRIEVPALRRGRLTGRLYGLQHSPVVHRLLADCERLRRRQLSSFAPRRLMT
jgi:hypothetical protein